MKQTQNKLVEYIKEKYQPLAIVLHGSRANGMAREHSDWDFLIFTKEDTKVITREIIFEANMELKQFTYPLSEDKVLGFYFRTENTKILFDPDNIVPELLEKNDARLKEGKKDESSYPARRTAFFLSALDGMNDYADNELILFDKKVDFYTRIVESWFAFKKKDFEPSHYFAFPIIEREDAELFELIGAFIKATSARELISTGEKIIKRIFPDFE